MDAENETGEPQVEEEEQNNQAEGQNNDAEVLVESSRLNEEAFEAADEQPTEGQLAEEAPTEELASDEAAAPDEAANTERSIVDQEAEVSVEQVPGLEQDTTQEAEPEEQPETTDNNAETVEDVSADIIVPQANEDAELADAVPAELSEPERPEELEQLEQEQEQAEQQDGAVQNDMVVTDALQETARSDVPDASLAAEKAIHASREHTEQLANQTASDENVQQTEPVQAQAQAQADEHEHLKKAAANEYRLEQPVVVKFLVHGSLMSDLTVIMPLGASVAQIKQQLSLRVNATTETLHVHFQGNELADDHLLAITNSAPHAEVLLEVRLNEDKPVLLKSKPEPVASRPGSALPSLRRPRSALNVMVKFDDGTSKELVTRIERHNLHKPNLGGLRDRGNGLVFSHAGTQTAPRPKPPPLAPLCTRDTQTLKIRTNAVQTHKDADTQMTGIGVYVATVTDKLVTPKQYETADEYLQRIERNVVVIQKWVRRWLAQRLVRKMMSERLARLEWEKEQEIRKLREKEARQRREYERRMNPKTKEDFDLLYSYLESWRKEELARINEHFSKAERKAHLCRVLDQETQLLTNIERQKQSALREARLNNITKLLGTAASPKKWYARDGKLTQMETPYIHRAKELKEIYECINMKYLTRDERLDVLLTLKHTVKEHDCELTREICELVDREADLLMRDVKEDNLDGLRKRISTLFLQYVKTPMFNPEISRLLRVPQDPLQLRKNIYYCISCNRYLPSTEFPLSTSSQTTGRCRNCVRLDNQARVRQDVSHFRLLLTQLRKAEQGFQDGSKIAFLIQENDLRYLVENIWGGQSLLSAWPDLYDLVLVRWDKRDEWAPWNCILLTRDEAVSHMKVENVKLAYRKEFINKVNRRHTLARTYFSKLPGMAEHLRFKEMNSHPTISGVGLASALF